MAESKSPDRVTIHDVAQMAGVSKSTVSRVLNDKGYASTETIERVQQAIEVLNYVPQMAARGLARQQTNALGLLVNEFSTLSTPPLLAGIDAVVQQENHNLLIAATGHQSGHALPLGMHNTDGLLAYADSISDAQLRRFYASNFPVVLIHRYPPEGLAIPCVNIENTESTQALITHLIEVHGCRRIAFLRGPERQEDSRKREESYVDTLKAHGIPVDPTLIGDGMFSEATSEKAVADWIAADVTFDAIFSGDDGAAFGAIRALNRAGLRVPEDVAVVGFDDDRHAPYVSPPLTTVRVPLEQVGCEAARRLIQLVRQGSAESVILPTQVIVRRSCGCPYELTRD
jgi:LacI family transcriptional regulator